MAGYSTNLPALTTGTHQADSTSRCSAATPQVREFQVAQDGPILRVLVVPRAPNPAAAAADNELETRLHHAITHQLRTLGVRHPHITVERRRELPRTAGGKLKLVIADPALEPRNEAPMEPVRLR